MSHRWVKGAGELALELDAASREEVFLEAQ